MKQFQLSSGLQFLQKNLKFPNLYICTGNSGCLDILINAMQS
uniref:Uncharacterized protein n=1 Tax=Setaria italica TaxID=4555 RepID=K3ZG33_SETIT